MVSFLEGRARRVGIPLVAALALASVAWWLVFEGDERHDEAERGNDPTRLLAVPLQAAPRVTIDDENASPSLAPQPAATDSEIGAQTLEPPAMSVDAVTVVVVDRDTRERLTPSRVYMLTDLADASGARRLTHRAIFPDVDHGVFTLDEEFFPPNAAVSVSVSVPGYDSLGELALSAEGVPAVPKVHILEMNSSK